MQIDLSTLTPEQQAAIQAILSPPEPKKRKGRKLPKVLKPEQVERLLDACKGNFIGIRNRAMYQCMHLAGLRVSEVCNLCPGDVDKEEKKIRVNNGKGGTDRIIPFGAHLLEELEKWEAIRGESIYYFHGSKGQRVSERSLNYYLESLSERAKVFIQDGKERKAVHAHVLRHCCATNWLNSGLAMPEIQLLLGHASIQTTSVYVHISNEALANKIRALG